MSEIEAAKVDDVPGHVVGIGEVKGLTFFDDGETAIFYGAFSFDYINGSGTFDAYIVNTFEDGSILAYEINKAETRAAKGGKISELRGQYTYIKGTGRFAGIKGGGVFSGKRIAPLSAGADSYTDFNGSGYLP